MAQTCDRQGRNYTGDDLALLDIPGVGKKYLCPPHLQEFLDTQAQGAKVEIISSPRIGENIR